MKNEIIYGKKQLIVYRTNAVISRTYCLHSAKMFVLLARKRVTYDTIRYDSTF